jgi:hypothetical protein
MSKAKLTTTNIMTERTRKLVDKFETMRSGDQILVGVAYPQMIRCALKYLLKQALIMRTLDRATRDDGVSVPVYLVTFT